jgi:hypothetical protein
VRCRANRPAIDSAGEHANKKLAIEARVARHPGSRTDLPIQFHIWLKLMVTPLRPKTWTFPDCAVMFLFENAFDEAQVRFQEAS